MIRINDRDRPWRTRALLAGLLTTTMLAGGGLAAAALSSPGAAATETQPAPSSEAPVFKQAGFADLVSKVRPAVVNIATTEKPERPDPQEMPDFPPGSPFAEMFKHFMENQNQNAEPRHALGSGFIVDPSGYIVTNNHVIDGARKITVTLEDGTTYPAKVQGADKKTDLALLKIDAGKPLPYVSFANSDQEHVGDWVIAVGNPFGLGGTVTAGIVSAHDRDLNSGPYDDYLQIDAPINPGNSGGPLFDQQGGVIGIDTAIYSPNGGSVGIGFAIPSNIASKVVAQLRENGSVERGWLGIQMQPITQALAKAMDRKDTEGVLVDKIEDDSPASAAKLQQGDIITAFNGTAVKNPRDLALDVAGTKSGTKVALTIWRDGHEQSVDVTIGKQTKEQMASRDHDAEGGRVGMALAPLNAENRDQFGLDPSVKGVVVARVQPDSRADESGVRAGDVIVRIGDEAVNTPSEVIARIRDAEHAKKQAVPMLVMRDGTTYYLALQLASS